MGDDREDAFAEGERQALDQWAVPEPPPEFAERVLELLEAKDPSLRSPRGGFRWVRGAVAAGAAAVAGLALWPEAQFGGVLAASERTTVELGVRAVLVAEPGTKLRYAGRGDRVNVNLEQGNVFFRVDRGEAPFEVLTPTGTVRVLGTCFRVETKTMNVLNAGLLGGAAGAAIATSVVVSVYEGRVEVTDTSKPDAVRIEALEAGQDVELWRRRSQIAGTELPGNALRTAVDAKTMSEAQVSEERFGAEAVDVAREEGRALADENEQLRRKVETLFERVAELEGEEARSFFEVDQAELRKMAERCELRWDYPSLDRLPSLSDDEFDRLGISTAERELIDRKLEEEHERLVAAIQRAYTAVTGDEVIGSLAPTAMFRETFDKTPPAEKKRIYQVLSRERAGLTPAPTPDRSMTPTEALMRVLTASGDRLERNIADELGPDVARSARLLNDGWNNKSQVMTRCPS